MMCDNPIDSASCAARECWLESPSVLIEQKTNPRNKTKEDKIVHVRTKSVKNELREAAVTQAGRCGGFY